MLLAVARIPPGAGAMARAAAATGLPLGEVSWRLKGPLPRVLLTDADAERIAAAARELEQAGFVAVSCDPSRVQTDRDRVVPRALDFSPQSLVATDAREVRHECPAAAILFVQRGARAGGQLVRDVRIVRQGPRERAVAFETIRETTDNPERFLLVHRDDGKPDIMIYEKQLSFRFLGAEMQPTSRANLELVLRRLGTLAPAAPIVDTVARPGFVAGLPETSVDAVDLGLFLIALAHRRSRRAGR